MGKKSQKRARKKAAAEAKAEVNAENADDTSKKALPVEKESLSASLVGPEITESAMVSIQEDISESETQTNSNERPVEAQQEKVTQQGYLMKKTSYNVWNKRWFVLRGHLLMFYKSPEAKKLLGCLDIWDACDISLLVKDTDDLCTSSASYKDFSIQVGDKFYIFKVETRDETKQWVDALRGVQEAGRRGSRGGAGAAPPPPGRRQEARLGSLRGQKMKEEEDNQEYFPQQEDMQDVSLANESSRRQADGAIDQDRIEIEFSGDGGMRPGGQKWYTKVLLRAERQRRRQCACCKSCVVS